MMAAEESNRDRFERLAPARVAKVLKALATLGNCANTSTYENLPHEIDDIFETIRDAVTTTEAKFRPKKRATNYELP